MQRVLIVEDERSVAELLRASLMETGYEVFVAYDAEMALRLLRGGGEYALVVSDVILPGLNGFELCKELRSIMPATPVLMLTALGTADDKLEGFDAGADDYMTKPFDLREFLARVKALTRRQSLTSRPSPLVAYADIVIDTARLEVRRAGESISLTPKEYGLLLYLVQNAERVVSRAEIAREVWGTTFDTGTNFIDVCLNYLRKKVDKPFPTRLIHTRPGVGFIVTEA